LGWGNRRPFNILTLGRRLLHLLMRHPFDQRVCQGDEITWTRRIQLRSLYGIRRLATSVDFLPALLPLPPFPLLPDALVVPLAERQ
jgi:hypothetical protein